MNGQNDRQVLDCASPLALFGAPATNRRTTAAKANAWHGGAALLAALVAVASWTGPGARAAAADKTLYANDFQKAAVGPVPDDFLVLDGGFTVKQDGDNKYLELPGAPVDSYGVLFGPTEKDGVAASVRIRTTARKRRAASFGVGLGGAGGYKLQLSPAKDEIAIYKGDDLKVKAPYQWASGQWTELRLQLLKIRDGAWKVQGKAWAAGGAEPKDWTIAFEFTEEPPSGRAAIWGQPYAGTPIQFDNLAVTAVAEKR